MHETTDPMPGAVVLDAAALDALIGELDEQGRQVLGPVRRDGAIVYDRVAGLADLPRGWIDEQDGGYYRLKREGDALFGHTVGPSSWKKFLHPPRQRLWSSDGDTIVPEPLDDTAMAFIGVRACELAAIQVQDKVLLEGPYVDPHYAARRARLFIVAVNCGRAGKTCFCTSMGTGPKVALGYDIALTEIGAEFLAEAGTDAGRALLQFVTTRTAEEADIAAATKASATAAAQITRSIDMTGLPDLLKANPNHPRWDKVASRCLNCANCTMVCPTCFCTTVDEVSALDSDATARESRWASCFTSDFSYVHGGAVRPGAKARYRQWMTHKLSTWFDQFGQAGCTGCGRCIAWCPVGIDITEEAAAIRGEGG